MGTTDAEFPKVNEVAPPIYFKPSEPVAVPTARDILDGDPAEFPKKFTDIGANNLACAVGLPRTEELDIPKALGLLDKMAATVKVQTERSWRLFDLKPAEFENSRNVFRIYTMTHVLGKFFGIHYNPERLKQGPDGRPVTDISKMDDGDTGDAFILGALSSRKTGICGTLPVLAVSVGRRLGYPLYLVKVPNHLLFRWHDASERFNVEYDERGCGVKTDEYYKEWPNGFRPQEWRTQPGSYRFLDSMAARYEMARFISNRIIALHHYNRHEESLDWIDALERFHGLSYEFWREESLRRVRLPRCTFASWDIPKTAVVPKPAPPTNQPPPPPSYWLQNHHHAPASPAIAQPPLPIPPGRPMPGAMPAMPAPRHPSPPLPPNGTPRPAIQQPATHPHLPNIPPTRPTHVQQILAKHIPPMMPILSKPQRKELH